MSIGNHEYSNNFLSSYTPFPTPALRGRLSAKGEGAPSKSFPPGETGKGVN